MQTLVETTADNAATVPLQKVLKSAIMRTNVHGFIRSNWQQCHRKSFTSLLPVYHGHQPLHLEVLIAVTKQRQSCCCCSHSCSIIYTN